MQKIHTYCAYKELDKCGQFEKMSGHKEKKVLCFVVNTSSVALMRYGNIRANDISQKFARKTYPQDLLHVYETLVLKDSTVNSMKVIERMTKLGRVGPNEATSLRKICKWSLPAFRCLMEVVKTFEAYETLDVKSSGNAGNISRGEKHCMTNAVFNNLGKVEESYFKENYHQVLSKKISLKTLVDGNIKIKEVEKVYGALGQISGFQTVQALKERFPGKFDQGLVEKFTGAEVLGEKKNLKAKLLEKYYIGVTKQGSSNVESELPVEFVKVESLDDLTVEATVDDFDAVVMIMKEPNKEICVSVMKKILNSVRIVKVGIMVFPNELLCFEVISYLRSQNTSLISDFQLIPVMFLRENATIVHSVEENLSYGVIFGKFVILNPPLKIYYNSMSMLPEVIENVVPPESNVAVFIEPGQSLVQVHKDELIFKCVKYFGSSEKIDKFKKVVNKQFSKAENSLGKLSDESSTSPGKDALATSSSSTIPSSSEKSSTSPVTVDTDSSPILTQDSGFGSPMEKKFVRDLSKYEGFSENLDRISDDNDIV